MDAIVLIDALENLGYEPRSYSGRGMYGSHCVAVTLDRDTNAFTIGAQLVTEMGEEGGDEVADLDVRQDSMGLGTVLYFPRVAWPAERSEAEDHDE